MSLQGRCYLGYLTQVTGGTLYPGVSGMSCVIMILLVVVCTILGHAGASPKERVMVRYKVKDGVKGERVKIADIKNTDDKTKDYQEVLNIVETGPIIPEEPNSIQPIPDYKKTATLMMGQLKKAARAGDL